MKNTGLLIGLAGAACLIALLLRDPTVVIAADASPAAPTAAETLSAEVKALRADVKRLSQQLETVQRTQKTLAENSALLVSARWEYRAESIHGGSTRERLTALLTKMGEDRFEYVGLTDSGLHLFRRRILPAGE